MAWALDAPHSHNFNSLPSNYCRNPDGEPGPWCYTTDPSTRWELCDIPLCAGCYTGDGATYAGGASTTVSGLTCQDWALDTPHSHNFNSLPSNYCRNPDGEPGPWCYTTDPSTRWQLCDVPACDAPVIAVIYSSGTTAFSSPSASGTVDLIPGSTYNVQVEILRNDLGSASERVTAIRVDGVDIGGCNPCAAQHATTAPSVHEPSRQSVRSSRAWTVTVATTTARSSTARARSRNRSASSRQLAAQSTSRSTSLATRYVARRRRTVRGWERCARARDADRSVATPRAPSCQWDCDCDMTTWTSGQTSCSRESTVAGRTQVTAVARFTFTLGGHSPPSPPSAPPAPPAPPLPAIPPMAGGQHCPSPVGGVRSVVDVNQALTSGEMMFVDDAPISQACIWSSSVGDANTGPGLRQNSNACARATVRRSAALRCAELPPSVSAQGATTRATTRSLDATRCTSAARSPTSSRRPRSGPPTTTASASRLAGPTAAAPRRRQA
jgi:hypothetical protein